MKKFRFSLETVLKVRRQAEELRQRELAEAQAQRDRLLHQLAGLENELRGLNSAQSGKREGRLDMNAEAWFRARHEGITRAKRTVRLELMAKEAALNEARARAVEASRERRVLEKLEEKQLSEHLQNLNKEEQGFLDDLAQRAISSWDLSSISATGLPGGASY